MSQKLKKTLEELASCSAWTFDEALLLLTGSTSHQIDYKKSHTLPPAPDIRYLLMSETKEWPIKEKQQAGRKEKKYRTGHKIYTKGNTEPVPAISAKKFIKNRWAENTESLAERKTRLKEEGSQYQKAQGQFKLMENLERAVLDNDIKTLNGTNQSSSSKWRLNKYSVLKWINSDPSLLPLRHFPKDIDDILVNKLLLSQPIPKTARPATNKAKMNRLREDYIFKATKKLKASPDLQFSFFKHDHSFMNIIRSSKLPTDKQPKDSTLERWVRKARKNANVKPSVGRPRTNYSEQQ